MANDTANDTAAASKKQPPVTQFQFAQKPEELPGWEGFKKFMWNKDTNQFMGRTGCSWRKYMSILIQESSHRLEKWAEFSSSSCGKTCSHEHEN